MRTLQGVDATEPGLRERKKQRTRQGIVDAALRLFAERGFDGTTVGDIAAAADIAPRTFFGYFPTKEAVLFHDFDEVHERFAARLLDRAPGESTIDALRAVIAELVAEADFDDPAERLRRDLVRSTPSLREHDRSLLARFEDTLAEAFAGELGVAPRSVRARMVAAAAAAAMSTLEQLYVDEDEAVEGLYARGCDPLPILDEALVFVRGGIAALRELPEADPAPAAGDAR